jgi:hypothetical protein
MSGDRAVIILAMTMPIRVYSVFLPEVRSADFRADVNIGNAEEWPRDCAVHNGLAFSWGKCEPPAECRSCSWIVAAQTRVRRRPPAAAAGSVPSRVLPPPIGRSAVGPPLRVGWLRRGLDHGMARPRLRRRYPQDAANYYRLLPSQVIRRHSRSTRQDPNDRTGDQPRSRTARRSAPRP